MYDQEVTFNGTAYLRWEAWLQRWEFFRVRSKHRNAFRQMWEENCHLACDIDSDHIEPDAPSELGVGNEVSPAKLPRQIPGKNALPAPKGPSPPEEAGAGKATGNAGEKPKEGDDPKKEGDDPDNKDDDPEDNKPPVEGNPPNGGKAAKGGGKGGGKNGGKAGEGGGKPPKEKTELDKQLAKLRSLKPKWLTATTDAQNLLNTIASNDSWSWARPATALQSCLDKITGISKANDFWENASVREVSQLRRLYTGEALLRELRFLPQLETDVETVTTELLCVRAMDRSRREALRAAATSKGRRSASSS